MKLIGLFGVLLAISPVFAAETGECAGNIPTMTVAECNGQPCTFEYVEGGYADYQFRFYRSCNEPFLKKSNNCSSFETMVDCLSHSCSWVMTRVYGLPKTGLICDSRAPRNSRMFKVQPPKEITEL